MNVHQHLVSADWATFALLPRRRSSCSSLRLIGLSSIIASTGLPGPAVERVQLISLFLWWSDVVVCVPTSEHFHPVRIRNLLSGDAGRESPT